MAKRRAMAAGRRIWRAVRRTGIGLLAVVALIALALLGGSFIPANRNWHPPARGVRIFVYSNGVHTGLLLPTVNEQWDWRPFAPASDLRDPHEAGEMLLFGWGDREFYLNTPSWNDLSISTALYAMIGTGRTLIHVDHVNRPIAGPDLKPIVLTPAQYRSLSQRIAAQFDVDTRGHRPSAIAGYGNDDAFYPARGHYYAARTCNEWTGSMLRSIGVRVGIWTPTAGGVMRWF